MSGSVAIQSDSAVQITPRLTWLRLLALVLAATAIKVIWIMGFDVPQQLDAEELEYLRLAQDIADGQGYIGLYGTPQIVHSPLYPGAVAVVYRLIHNIENAGVAVSVLSGMLLAISLYFLALKLHGSRAALMAAILAAFAPFLIWLSGQALSEALYVGLLMTALLFSTSALAEVTVPRTLVAGVSLGVAYLARPTALLILPLITLFLARTIWTYRQGFRALVLQLLFLFIGFFMPASLHMAYLYQQTGHLLVDGKSVGLRAKTLMIYDGASKHEAGFSIDPATLRLLGFDLDHTAFTLQLLQQPDPQQSTLIWVMETAPHLPDNGRPLAKFLVKMTLPALFFLGVAGFWLTFRKDTRRLLRLFVLCSFGILALSQLALPWFVTRYGAPFYPFMLLWAAGGFVFSLDFVARRNWLSLSQAHAGTDTLIVAGAIFLCLSLLPAAVPLLRRQAIGCDELHRAAGDYLKDIARGDVRVVDRSLVTAYYSGGTAIAPPHTDEATALRYLDTRNPTHVALSTSDCKHSAYLCDWLERGMPTARGSLMAEFRDNSSCRVKLYEWKHLPTTVPSD